MRTKSVKATSKKAVSKKVVKKATKPKSTKRVIKYEDGGKKSILKSKGIKRPLRTKERVNESNDDYGIYEIGYKTSRTNPITGRKVEKSKTTSGFKAIDDEDVRQMGMDYLPKKETRKKTIIDKKGNVKEKVKIFGITTVKSKNSKLKPKYYASKKTKTVTKNGEGFKKTNDYVGRDKKIKLSQDSFRNYSGREKVKI
jgi:hypothetical protein